MARSETILGRAPNRRAFKQGKPFKISAYRAGQDTRFSDPIRYPWCYPKPSVVYRLIITPKVTAPKRVKP